MNFRLKTLFYILIAVIIWVSACKKNERNSQSVEQAMNKYDRFILHMDVDSIALLYTPDGELGKIALGRDSIRKFLDNFKKYKVLSQESKTDLISVRQDTALQTGTYRQTVIILTKDTVTVRGLFTTKWIWLEGTGWHIKHMETQPAK